ncbi:MAG: hypothetical protein KDB14_34395, partial [Planctomycetales bacterium]|nr:hypothetical protein [Planctomycetales bacterium]
HTLSETAPGSSVFVGSNATPDALVTVTTDSGTITTADASSLYAGVQVLADPAGNFTFSVSVPSGDPLPNVTSEEVTGLKSSTASGAAAPLPPIRRFDFNNTTSPTQAGFTGVRANDTYLASVGYGYSAMSFSHLDRGAPTSMSSNELYRDGHWGNSTAKTFRVKADAGQTYDVRVYIGDRNFYRDNIEVTVEGGGTIVSGPLSANVFSTLTLFGATDTDMNGSIDITFRDAGGSDAFYVVNGLDVAESGVGLPASAPLLVSAAGTDGASLTDGQLQPIVSEALARWEASGLTPAQLGRLQNVQVSIANLAGQGAYGLAGSNRVLIDDNAAGSGWYIDPTPHTNDGFALSGNQYLASGQMGGQVDLLTVVMHELGHIVGLGDQDPAFSGNSLMTGRIDPGIRRLSLASEVDEVFTSLRDDSLELRYDEVANALWESNDGDVDETTTETALPNEVLQTERRRREQLEALVALELGDHDELASE